MEVEANALTSGLLDLEPLLPGKELPLALMQPTTQPDPLLLDVHTRWVARACEVPWLQ